MLDDLASYKPKAGQNTPSNKLADRIQTKCDSEPPDQVSEQRCLPIAGPALDENSAAVAAEVCDQLQDIESNSPIIH